VAQPQPYSRTADFAQRDGDDTDHNAINQEFDGAALTIGQLRACLALIQRDDGALQNGIVTAESLAPSATEALRGAVEAFVTLAQQASESALTSASVANLAMDNAGASAALAVSAQGASAANAVVSVNAAGTATNAKNAAALSAGNAAASEAQALLNAQTGPSMVALAAPNGTEKVGDIAPGAGMVPRMLAAVLRDTISVKSAGAACDYVTNDATAIQRVIDEAPAGSTIEVYKHAITGPLYVNKALTIKAKSGRAKFLQSTWGHPCFIVHATADVEFDGDFAFEYVGARPYPIPVPTHTDTRIQDFYALHAGSERILCSGIAVRGQSDNFKTGDISSKGFFCGITHIGNTTNTLIDSKNVRHGVISVDTVDWGVLVGGGVADMTIAGITARNIKVTSPSDPAHAIYVGPRSVGVMYESINIGFINLNGVDLLAAGANNGDAFSFRSCKNAYVGSVSVLNSRLIGNTRDGGKLTIGMLRADLSQSEVEPVSGLVAAISAQSDSSITIIDADVTARNNVSGAVQNVLFQASSTGSLYIRAGKYKFVGATCGPFSYFGGKNFEVGAGVSIEYDNPVAVSLPAGEAAPMFVYDVTGNLLVDRPSLKGETKLLYFGGGISAAAVDRTLITLDPNRLFNGSTDTTVFDSTTKYRIVFSSFARTPSLITAAATQCILQGRNTVITQNTGATALSTFSRGSNNQRYLILAGDALTSITHGNFASGFVSKTGLNIAAGTWKSIEAVWLTDRLYELGRTTIGTPIAVVGNRGSNAGLASLLTAMAANGQIINSTAGVAAPAVAAAAVDAATTMTLVNQLRTLLIANGSAV
jgi:hypothetical protein